MKATKLYPISYLFTMITELLRELKLDDEYTVADVRSFGYNPSADDVEPSIWIEVFSRDHTGLRSGTLTISRFIERDISWADWGNPSTEAS